MLHSKLKCECAIINNQEGEKKNIKFTGVLRSTSLQETVLITLTYCTLSALICKYTSLLRSAAPSPYNLRARFGAVITRKYHKEYPRDKLYTNICDPTGFTLSLLAHHLKDMTIKITGPHNKIVQTDIRLPHSGKN